MPVESVQPLLGRPLRTAALATPPRLRPKGPVGPDFYRQSPAAAERPKQSAVERLEADKAKYVKSPVALSKQQPVGPPVMRKPAAATNASMRPTRKTPTQQNTQQGNVPFNLAHLSNLISGVNDSQLSSSTVTSEDTVTSNCTTTTSTTTTRSSELDDAGQGEERSAPPPPGPDWSTPAKVRLKASCPAKTESPGPVAAPAAVTVRRVDVMPQVRPVRTPPCRPPRYIRQPLQPMPLLPQSQLRPTTSNQHLFYPRKLPGPSPLKPVAAPPKPYHPASTPADASSTPSPDPAPAPPPLPDLPPASPAITRLSSSSSRKRPSLTRSKSDMSERYSRVGTELERFFSMCGMDPSEMQDLTKASSDIVSLARFRSASAPGSECGGSGGEEGGDGGGEDDGDARERLPYGISVIERNARVIKWLYGVRQAKDTKVTNM